MRRRLGSILKFAVSLGLLIVLLARVGIRQALATLKTAHWSLLLLGLSLYIVGIALRAVRWRALLRAQSVTVPLSRLVALYYVGSFFNIMLPTGVGGDAVRAYELARDCGSSPISVGTVLADRAIGLLALFLMAALALPFSVHLLDTWLIALVLALTVGSFVGVALFLWPEPLRRISHALPTRLRYWINRPALRKIYFSFRGYNWRALTIAAGVSVLFNLLLVAVNVLIGISLDVHVGLQYYLIVTSIASALLILPISISGLGVREWEYVVLFGRVGVPATTAVSMSLAFYLINVLSGLIGGVLYAWEGAHGIWRSAGEGF
jgi:uncharacterized protein (TIRG00374 family)